MNLRVSTTFVYKSISSRVTTIVFSISTKVHTPQIFNKELQTMEIMRMLKLIFYFLAFLYHRMNDKKFTQKRKWNEKFRENHKALRQLHAQEMFGIQFFFVDVRNVRTAFIFLLFIISIFYFSIYVADCKVCFYLSVNKSYKRIVKFKEKKTQKQKLIYLH